MIFCQGPDSYYLINYRHDKAVVCKREYVADQPLSTDLLNHKPEALMLDIHNMPLVQSELVCRKPVILGAKLYFPFPPNVNWKYTQISSRRCFCHVRIEHWV